MRMLLSCIYCGVVAACTGGCAPANSPKIDAQPAPSTTGEILAVRPIAPPPPDGPVRAALPVGVDSGQRASVEFIVRTDDGSTLSIVQNNGPGFQAGDRVVILRGDRTRLARPG